MVRTSISKTRYALFEPSWEGKVFYSLKLYLQLHNHFSVKFLKSLSIEHDESQTGRVRLNIKKVRFGQAEHFGDIQEMFSSGQTFGSANKFSTLAELALPLFGSNLIK